MRVTNNMMMNAMTASLQQKSQLILKLTEQVSTGKKISKPSDDPLGMARSMDYQETISKVDQYMENISRGKTKLEVIENILEEVENQIINVKEIAVEQSMGELETRDTAAELVRNAYEELLALSNSEFESSYLFSGYATDTQPYTLNIDETVSYNGDSGDQEIIISKNNHVKINTHGEEVFSGPDVNIFDAIYNLIQGLEDPDTAAGTVTIQAAIADIEASQEQVNAARTRNAGTYDRLDTSESYWENFKSGIEDQLSKVMDADLTQALVELQNAELVYETSLAMSKEIIQNSLLSFLS